jgi:hypothetical protein
VEQERVELKKLNCFMPSYEDFKRNILDVVEEEREIAGTVQ